MAKFELKLPRMGESVAEATLTSWLVEVGSRVEVDDGVLEVSTDKVDTEIPSEVAGVLVEKLFDGYKKKLFKISCMVHPAFHGA